MEGGFGLFNPLVQCLSLPYEQGRVKQDNHSKRVGPALMFDGQRNFKTPVNPAFMRNDDFLVMMIKGLMKGRFIGFIHGQGGKEKALMIMDVGHVLPAGKLGVGNIEELPVIE